MAGAIVDYRSELLDGIQADYKQTGLLAFNQHDARAGMIRDKLAERPQICRPADTYQIRYGRREREHSPEPAAIAREHREAACAFRPNLRADVLDDAVEIEPQVLDNVPRQRAVSGVRGGLANELVSH